MAFNPDSPDWRAACDLLRKRRDSLRADLESLECDDRTTQQLRGRIHEINELLDLKEERAKEPKK